MISKMKNIIVNFIIIILTIIAMVVIYVFIQTNISDNSYINLFGYSFFKTETGSMKDTIEIGDIVVVKIGQEVEENDIITYYQNSSFITHRVIKIQDDKIATKGDNNNSEDEPIKKEQVVGKVVYIIRNVEIWKQVFTDKNVIIPVTITIVLLIILVFYKEKTEGEKNE